MLWLRLEIYSGGVLRGVQDGGDARTQPRAGNRQGRLARNEGDAGRGGLAGRGFPAVPASSPHRHRCHLRSRPRRRGRFIGWSNYGAKERDLEWRKRDAERDREWSEAQARQQRSA